METECLNCHRKFEYYPAKTRGKYCNNKCQQEKAWIDWKIALEKDNDAKNRGALTVKKYLLEKRGRKCELCGITEWQGMPLVTIMDHIDGNSSNWKLDNLRLLCSNCDSTLPTYKKRNVGNGRFNRRKRYAEGLSY